MIFAPYDTVSMISLLVLNTEGFFELESHRVTLDLSGVMQLVAGTLLSPSLLFISVNNNNREVFYGDEAGRIKQTRRVSIIVIV